MRFFNSLRISILVFSTVFAGLGCSDAPSPEDPGGSIDCANATLGDFKEYLDVVIEVAKTLDDPAHELPESITLDWESGAGNFGELSTVLGSAPPREMTGQVRPKDACEDGMVKDEVCVVPWDAVVTVAASPISGLGTMSIVSLGETSPGRTSTRITIVEREPEVNTSSQCGMTASSFDMLWHLRTDEMYSFTMSIEVNPERTSSGTETTSGSVAWGTSVGDTATMTLTTSSTSRTCAFDLDTFQLSDCSEERSESRWRCA